MGDKKAIKKVAGSLLLVAGDEKKDPKGFSRRDAYDEKTLGSEMRSYY